MPRIILNRADGLFANSCFYEGVPGFMVEHVYEGRVLCSHFISAEIFEKICEVKKIKES